MAQDNVFTHLLQICGFSCYIYSCGMVLIRAVKFPVLIRTGDERNDKNGREKRDILHQHSDILSK